MQYTNTLVLRFCIPCLQIWLLAVKTDMQQSENWRCVVSLDLSLRKTQKLLNGTMDNQQHNQAKQLSHKALTNRYQVCQ